MDSHTNNLYRSPSIKSSSSKQLNIAPRHFESQPMFGSMRIDMDEDPTNSFEKKQAKIFSYPSVT